MNKHFRPPLNDEKLLTTGMPGLDECALHKRVFSITFDDPDASFPFSERLARDNAWDEDFAKRVLFEYRRFAYLIVRSGRELTPSDAVDQAWHLHLTYSRHYWGEWTDALGRSIHHGPTKGGGGEARRYDQNYRDTLTLYEETFGEAPPKAIWPDPKERFRNPERFKRLDTSQYVILKRPSLVGLAAVFGLLLLGLTAFTHFGGFHLFS
ncbi:MAG: hypothetical protein AAGE89_09300 [Pseudomonadota bacterium]